VLIAALGASAVRWMWREWPRVAVEKAELLELASAALDKDDSTNPKSIPLEAHDPPQHRISWVPYH
jgi:hypothetical protein